MLALERRIEPRALDAGRDTRGGNLEDRQVTLAECPWNERPDVQHSDQITLDDERQAQQRADALLAQDRVEDVGMVDVGDRDRHALARDPAREPTAERQP